MKNLIIGYNVGSFYREGTINAHRSEKKVVSEDKV
jgi:hypothetical protein